MKDKHISQSTVKYHRLIDTAMEMFISAGYRNISVDDIAESAGISKVTLYKHFPSKEDLFLFCVKQLTDQHYEQIRDVVSRCSHAIDKLHSLFQYNLEVRSNYSQAFIQDMMGTPHIWKEIGPYRKEKAKQLCREILEEGVSTGEFQIQHISHTLELLLSFGDIIPQLYPYNNPPEQEAFLENLYAFIQGALTRQRPSGGPHHDI